MKKVKFLTANQARRTQSKYLKKKNVRFFVFPLRPLRLCGKCFFLCVLCGFTVNVSAYAGERLHKEQVYQEAWCGEADGVMEYDLPDGTRVDCLTSTHAIEIGFADQWYGAIGLSLHYARIAGRKPGIVLILESLEDVKYLEMLRPIAEETGIRVWVIGSCS